MTCASHSCAVAMQQAEPAQLTYAGAASTLSNTRAAHEKQHADIGI